MKSYMDIENLRDVEEKLGDIIRETNIAAFEVGDHIQITEKYDGSNASIEKIDGQIYCFSRQKQLDFHNTLNGFYQYIQNKALTIPETLVIFGEWSGAKNKIVYEKKNTWLVFDIFDRNTETYWSQDRVKEFCAIYNLEYIHELYNGPFVSWDHCRSFTQMPHYGCKQEGVVVKNQDKLQDSRGYFYLKIVNTDFKERMKTREPKEIDPEKVEAEANARALMESIVTRNRIEKMLFKLRDEGIIGNELTPKDLGTVARYLPKRIYEDCVKEEHETIIAAGEFAGKLCSGISMEIARKIIIG